MVPDMPGGAADEEPSWQQTLSRCSLRPARTSGQLREEGLQGGVVDAVGGGPPAGRVGLVDEAPGWQVAVPVGDEDVGVAGVAGGAQDAADAENAEQDVAFGLVALDHRSAAARAVVVPGGSRRSRPISCRPRSRSAAVGVSLEARANCSRSNATNSMRSRRSPPHLNRSKLRMFG